MRLSKVLRFAALALACAALQAHAVAIVGTSGGSFTNLSSCTANVDCRIVDTTNGPNTQVQWGSTASTGTGFVNPSTLTSVDVNINASTPANDLILAQLDWYNSATTYDSQLLSFGVSWNFSIVFTQPGSSTGSEVFSFTIDNPINPSPDILSGLTLSSLQGIEINLAGVSVSDLKYCVVGGSCFNGSNPNDKWVNQELAVSTLYIKGDFTAVSALSAPTRVPEPSTLALLGAALVGLGLAQRRRKIRD